MAKVWQVERGREGGYIRREEEKDKRSLSLPRLFHPRTPVSKEAAQFLAPHVDF